MTFFEELKKSSASEFEAETLEAFARALDELAGAGASRFSVGRIMSLTGLSREVGLRLLGLAAQVGIMNPVYEIDCPKCGSLVGPFFDETFREETSLECVQPACEARFSPSSAEVRVLFDFSEDYVRQGSYSPG